MPDRRVHRGPHPEDAAAFAPALWPILRNAVTDYSWLLDRGYAAKSALKLVGDRFNLTERQRLAVMRSACSDAALARRHAHLIEAEQLAGDCLLLDGYNVLTTIEAALAGGVILVGRDGCYRDLASMHGTFRKVQETGPALELLGGVLAQLGVRQAVWYLDAPVSNSGRLKGVMRDIALQHGWKWHIEVVVSPDAVLSASPEIIASADSIILDRCARWFNLARQAVTTCIPDVHIVALGEPESLTPDPASNP